MIFKGLPIAKTIWPCRKIQIFFSLFSVQVRAAGQSALTLFTFPFTISFSPEITNYVLKISDSPYLDIQCLFDFTDILHQC